jgi:DNA (cytosine-5)-methyltransferase 1
MGVPDDYPLPAKYNDAYHVFGDGVAVPVVRWIEKHLLYPLAMAGSFEQVA